MIKFSLLNIIELNLPLDSYSAVCERGDSKKILLQLDKKYKHTVDSSIACSCERSSTGEVAWDFYENPAFNYVDNKDKEIWIENYQIFIRSSIKYKLWIFFYRFLEPFLLINID